MAALFREKLLAAVERRNQKAALDPHGVVVSGHALDDVRWTLYAKPRGSIPSCPCSPGGTVIDYLRLGEWAGRTKRVNEMRMIKWIGIAVVGIAVLGVGSSESYAASVVCPDNIGNSQPIDDNVIGQTSGGNAGCELGSVNNDSETAVNTTDSMFGFTDWDFAQKDEDVNGTINETDIDIGLAFTGGQTSGTWSINDVWATYSSIMLVFKDGSDEPDTYVGYLLNAGDTSGDYETPFVNTNPQQAGNPKNISHITAYVRQGVTVPEPASLAAFGLGLGLLGLGGAAGRRSRRNRRR